MRPPMHPPITAAQVRELLATHASVDLPSGEEIHARPDAARFLDALAEVSFLVSNGDRRLAQDEMQCLAGTLAELSSGTIDRSALAGMIYEYSAALERDGLDARLSAIIQRFADPRERLRLLAFGSLVAMCDRALQPGERQVLRTIASRMGVQPEEIDACVDALQKSLHEVS
jgi:tellurite resistance protein